MLKLVIKLENFIDKIDNAEECLLIKNLGSIIPTYGDYKDKLTAVINFFGPEGTCALKEVKEVFALNIRFSLVYVRMRHKSIIVLNKRKVV